MFAKGQTVIQWMEQLAPKHLAYPDDRDRIGLQLGTLQKEIRTVLVALDVNEEVVDEAVRIGADLIIAHHAIIFRPLKSIQTDSAAGKVYERLIKHDIAVYIAHTNLDNAEWGMNDWMAEALGIRNTVPVEETQREPLYKLAVFVPATHADQVREAVFGAGAGAIGNYSHCSFNVAGTGTFLPQEGTNPFLGSAGKLEQAEEVRIETIVPQSIRSSVIQAMLKAHPYEEVAYDLYPLDLKGKAYGLGRAGKLEKEMTLAAFSQVVKDKLDVPHVRVVGDPDRIVKKAAVIGGSGSRYYQAARFRGADVLVTGDVDYHTAQDALAAGIALIDPGHNAEKIMKAKVADWLKAQAEKHRYDIQAVASAVDTEPFRFM
ncbi:MULTISPECIES: Nif3-like dinuclear metal center hexameric protein [Paenibacillus]|uniref:GTP cyclohydrolase 1 type 2 homolog n=1 Tax=Paenibacillus albilobatus TaxID=2716884 RepID=A0A920CDV0_9BACL|nr:MULTISPECIES: Nif3-like dinuclear metal center hexameric protein [Paenibacillus]GIO34183.1 GTP cyclohydrolase 1 type 2 [Paenibacillus albilobatus]